jgi:DNA-binding CsgD family transcriptional regulator
LLSENEQQVSTTSVQTYLDHVNLEFKVNLDIHFPMLKQKEKDLLSLMKLGLNAGDIKTIQNTTLASVKSSRYRIRKKLGLNSDEDIILYIERFKESPS